MPLNIEPIDRNQRTAFQEREALRNKVNEIIETVVPMEITWDAVPTAGHGSGYAVTSEGIKTAIDNEATARQTFDSDLQAAIITENTERNTADAELEAAINTEQDTRASEDVSIRSDITALGTRITTEETARANQDTALETRIDSKQNTLTQGTGITIANDIISATGISVTAGIGIQIADGVISQTNTRNVKNSVVIGSTFFTDLQNALSNVTPFTFVVHGDGQQATLPFIYLSFTGYRQYTADRCYGSGILWKDAQMFLVYQINGLATNTDNIEVYCMDVTSGLLTTQTFTKSAIIATNMMIGDYNAGLV